MRRVVEHRMIKLGPAARKLASQLAEQQKKSWMDTMWGNESWFGGSASRKLLDDRGLVNELVTDRLP